ncbi:hypothetical protein BJ973_007201 [Actinoplanes tereljensis]
MEPGSPNHRKGSSETNLRHQGVRGEVGSGPPAAVASRPTLREALYDAWRRTAAAALYRRTGRWSHLRPDIPDREKKGLGRSRLGDGNRLGDSGPPEHRSRESRESRESQDAPKPPEPPCRRTRGAAPNKTGARVSRWRCRPPPWGTQEPTAISHRQRKRLPDLSRPASRHVATFSPRELSPSRRPGTAATGWRKCRDQTVVHHPSRGKRAIGSRTRPRLPAATRGDSLNQPHSSKRHRRRRPALTIVLIAQQLAASHTTAGGRARSGP